MIPDLTPAEVARFYGKMQMTEHGMLWTGPVNSMGYGRFEIYRGGKRVRVLAHRLAYVLATGHEPDAAVIRHGCDTPLCCTPDCLEPGTQADNLRDAAERGRVNTTGLTASREAREARIESRIATGVKVCTGCGEAKSFAGFGLNRAERDGHTGRCKACLARYRRQRKMRQAGRTEAA